ncbi:MAG: enoyl-CoA hydratase/isomerase family protein [Chlamydiia bacterium]|nr:enoyl-CoA hydratase/isomerase family protein [Chlamydiia bacterium]
MNDNRIKELKLDRPEKYNALTEEMIDRLLKEIEAVDGVRVILLYGEGGNFSSGADLKGDAPKIFEKLVKLFSAMKSSPKIIIGLVDGHCIAGGFGLLAAADLAIATPEATFQLPETRRGLIAPLVASVSEHILPKRILKEMALTGEPLSAERLYNVGFLNCLSEKDQLLEFGYKMAEQILLGGPEAIYLTKRMLSQKTTPLKEALDWQFKALSTGEPAEGLNAFKEKRPPNWVD